MSVKVVQEANHADVTQSFLSLHENKKVITIDEEKFLKDCKNFLQLCWNNGNSLRYSVFNIVVNL